MGDRTYVSARIHPLDWHLVYDLLDFPKALSTVRALWDKDQGNQSQESSTLYTPEEFTLESDKTIAIECYEANYGYYDEWIEAAQRGARFRAYHSYGGEYGPGSAIGLNFCHYYTELTHEGSDMYVTVSATGEVNEEHLRRVKEFIEASDKFENSLKLLPDTWEEIIPLCHNKMPNG